jgi:hypothetical protein
VNTRAVSAAGFSPDSPAKENLFESLSAKLSGADIATECALILSETNQTEMRTQRQGIRVQNRRLHELQERRMEALKKIWEASRQSGFWHKLTKVFSHVGLALSALASVFCPGTIAGIGLASAGAGGFSRIMGAGCDRKAVLASGQKLQIENQKQEAKQMREAWTQGFAQAIEVERRLRERIKEIQQRDSFSR